jgi:hypothetical protein
MPGWNWLSRLAVYMYRPSGVHIQQIAGGGLRLSGMTFLFCNRHLWVYDNTEIQGRATVSKKTGTNFLWFSNPPPLCTPVQYQASLAATEHLTPQDFIQNYFLQELKRVCKCISITYQYISVSTIYNMSGRPCCIGYTNWSRRREWLKNGLKNDSSSGLKNDSSYEFIGEVILIINVV